MKSASNGGILKGGLQVLHVHVLLVAPLGTGHMAQPGTNQHKGRVAVWETAHHTGAAADLPVQPLNDIVGADTGPMLTGYDIFPDFLLQDNTADSVHPIRSLRSQDLQMSHRHPSER